MTRWFGLLVTVVLMVYACGDPKHAGTIGGDEISGAPSFGGKTSAKGGGSSVGGAGEAGAPSGMAGDHEGGAGGAGGEVNMPVDPRAPIVEITSPANALDPNTDGVLTQPMVTVTCHVRRSTAPGSELVDTTSVFIAQIDAKGKVLSEVLGHSPVQDEADANYSATFSIDQYKTGPITFRCSATDQSDSRHAGHASSHAFVDHGPTITPVTPIDGQVLALKSVGTFDVIVEPAQLTADDQGADVAGVQMKLGAALYPLTADPANPGHYSAVVNFEDEMIPTGSLGVTVLAANSRKPKPITSTLAYNVKLDGESPTITISSPQEGDILGQELKLVFTVVDATAVNAKSITVSINGNGDFTYVYDVNDKAHWSTANGKYVLSLNSTDLADNGSVAQLNIAISAADALGNATEDDKKNATLTIYLDNQPPIVDLDPAPLVTVHGLEESRKCSWPFDPLGIALGDGDPTLEAGWFRALVWDRTNVAMGQGTRFYSGVRANSVKLYIQPNLDTPLYIDDVPDDDDDSCTTLDVSTAFPTDLAPITSSGTHPQYEYSCPNGLEDPLPSKKPDPASWMCNGRSDLTFRMKHEDNDYSDDVLYAKFVPNGLCTGETWEILAIAKRYGWVCLGATASDNVGNVGYSPPLRVCIYDGTEEGKAVCQTEMPSCAGNCVPRFPHFTGPVSYTSYN